MANNQIGPEPKLYVPIFNPPALLQCRSDLAPFGWEHQPLKSGPQLFGEN